MSIDPIQTTPDDLLTLPASPRWLKTRGLRGVSYNTLNRILSHAAISRQSDYPEFVSGRHGLRLSLSLPCKIAGSTVE
jgi:hypothetical protein